MSRGSSKTFVAGAVLLAIALSGAGVVAVVNHTRGKRAAPSGVATNELVLPAEAPPAPTGPPGRVKLTLQLPPGSALGAVGYVVQTAANTVAARGSIPIADPSVTSVSQELVLPSGRGQSVTFVGSVPGTSENGGASRSVFLGRQALDVPAGGKAEVSFSAGTSSGKSGGGLGLTGAKGDDESCQACQLASAVPLCDPPNLTATSSQDPRTGEQTGIGWGCGTLQSAGARAACTALLHCLNVQDCEKGGRNPVMGCYCGSASATSCFAGQGIDGPCIAEYNAAAAASVGGPAAGATVSQLSRFIATVAADPTTAIGLADNIRKCAIDTPCEVCEAL